jgi:hypothetical protein
MELTKSEIEKLVKLGIILPNQDLKRTAERHLRLIRDAVLPSPKESIMILRALKVDENRIQEALRKGQEKIDLALEKLMEEGGINPSP